MAILGIPSSDEYNSNPEYTITDFKFWMPSFKNYAETADGITMFDNLYPIANGKILYTIFGSDWKYAMSLCIAHYATIIGKQSQVPSGSTLADASVSGGAINGIINSASVGGFTKSFDLDRSMSADKEAIWWNQTAWGQQLYNLFLSKPAPTIFVVTSNYVPGSGNL